MNVKKLWIAVLVGMLLVLSLAGEAGARERAAVSAWKYVTVPAGHFIPTTDSWAYSNNGYYLTGDGNFTAPVVFPGSGQVIVKKVILFAVDNTVGADVDVTLYKTDPAAGVEVSVASAASIGNESGIRTFKNSTIKQATITRSRGAYLWLSFDVDNHNLRAYAVKVAYVD